METSVEQFYNAISRDYNDLLDRAVPRYREMLGSVLYYLPSGFSPRRILELGCGTGNLTEYVVRQYPEAAIDVVDISGAILQECQQRFASVRTIAYHQADFKTLAFPANSYDLVVSSIAIHHLEDEHKRLLFQKVSRFLRPEGRLVYADQCRGSTEDIYQKNMERWREEALRLGSSAQDWDTWMNHQAQHDFHSPVRDQIAWLEEAAFTQVDVVWRNLLWAVFYAEKQR